MGDGTAEDDLLRARLFTVRPADGPLSLPELLARLLAGDEVAGFPELAPEQRGYWWRFLVRCAAKALHTLGLSVAQAAGQAPGELAARLGDTLADLAPDGAWRLHQPDPARPGFLQTPAPGATLDGYSARGISLLTGALGSKNHERKAEALRALTPEQVVYALVEYQTAANYGGVGNYGSQLQGSASGAGSGTPFMGARIAGSEQQTFRHDVQVMLTGRPAVAAELRGPIWALWAEPWSGAKDDALPSTRLDPAFIPLARMVRLGPPRAGRYETVWFRGSQGKRVADHTATPVGKDAKGGGLLGDPFTPQVVEPFPKVRGTLDKGYDYTEVVGLLFGGDKFAGPSPSVRALVERGELERDDLSVVFEGVAYEQGKTVGFHRREVLLPAIGGLSWLADPAPVRLVHEVMLPLVRDAKSALRGAARIVLTGSPRPKDTDRAKTDQVADRLERRVDAGYLEHLFDGVRRHQEDGSLDVAAWADWLAGEAWRAWRAAVGALPCNTNQRLEREVRAEAYLGARLKALRGEEAFEDD